MKKLLMKLFGLTNTINSLKNTIIDMEAENKDYVKRIDLIQQRANLIEEMLEQYQNNLFNEHNDDVNFNFSKIPTISIERITTKDTYIPFTVIGYLNKEGNLKEWYLNISEEKHKELLQEFKNSKLNLA